jgi:hypothetical protein
LSVHFKLVLFIKCFRVIKGFAVFNVHVLMLRLKKFRIQKSAKRCRSDPKYAIDMLEDHNEIKKLIYFDYFLIILKLVLQIINITFFFGLLWFVFCDLTESLHAIDPLWSPMLNFEESFVNNEDFLNYALDMRALEVWNQLLIICYFSLTTISTVGFGDFNPRSDYERLAAVGVLLFGVIIFSYVLGNFTAILQNFN